MRLKTALLAAGLAFVATAGAAEAQGLMGIAQQNMMFDAQMNAQISAMQQQNAMYQQQLWQNYLRQYGPMLQQEYQQYVASGAQPRVTFEQFAYWCLMTANGTNVQGALQAQQQRFQGMQQAARTQQEGFANYNAGMQHNSQVTSNAIENYDRQAVQGNSPYVDSNGATHWLPYSAPAGQVTNSGGTNYVQDQTGTYWQQQGNSWVRMNPAQR